MKNKLVIFILAIGFIGIVFGIANYIKYNVVPKVSAEDTKGVLRHAPDFMLLDIDGKEKRLSDFNGKVVVLNFWATWCPVCRVAIKYFKELYSKYKDKGLEIIGISLDESRRKVAPFVKKNDINYTVLLGDTDVADLYGGIMAIPVTFIIDREGNIRKRYIGYKDKEAIEKDIKQFL